MAVAPWQPSSSSSSSSLAETSANSASSSTTQSVSPVTTKSESPATTQSESESESESAPLSLYGITRRYCREELIIGPVRWTGRHVELLRFSFSQLFPEPMTVANVAVTEGDYSEERCGTRHLKDFFDFYYNPQMREQGIWLLITTDACPLVIYQEPVKLALGSSIVKNLHCMAFYLRDSTTGIKEHKLPVAALVDQGRIVALRKECLGISRCSEWCYWNRPMCRLYEKKWKKLTPPIMLNDPYITALLIGLAQQKRRYLLEINSQEEAMTGKLSSQVVFTYNSRGRCKDRREESYLGCLYLYQADIPSSLLDMFEHPDVPPPESPSVEIRITRVNYRPLATFRARLLELMLPGNAAATAAAEAAAEAAAAEAAMAQATMAQAVAAEESMEQAAATEEAFARAMAQENLTEATMAQMNMPQVHMPQMNMPQMNVAQVNMAPMHMLQAHMPQMHMPQMNMPQMNMPQMNMAQMHMPQINMAQMHMAQMNMPQINMEQMNMEQMNMPQINMAQMHMAQMNMPQMNMAQMNMTQATMVQTTDNHYAGQKRKFEGQHVDQPSSQWVPSEYVCPMNTYY